MNTINEFPNSLTQDEKRFGSSEYSVQSTTLRAGQLSMIYENGAIRSVLMGGHEIIRMIYSAVRDKLWLTITPIISEETHDIRADSFLITYQCRYQSGDIDFVASFRIQGNTNNSVIFEMHGEALSSFHKNRIGFCVLHPIEGLAGMPCIITHSDLSEQQHSFPRYIEPHQPFKDVIGMKWKCSSNIQSELKFTGDIFETEDHRNWTDASFKTYCTPLYLPFPVFIDKGEKNYQKVELQVNVNHDIVDPGNEVSIQVNPGESIKMPAIGIGRSTRKISIQPEEILLFKHLVFDHYRFDIYLFDKCWRQTANIAVQEAIQLGYGLEMALFFDENFHTQLEDFIRWVKTGISNIARIIIFHKSISSTPNELLEVVVSKLRKTVPEISIGGGTNANFAQVNRARPAMDLVDFIAFSIHPQEHAFDNLTLIENLEAQKYAVESAKQISVGKPVVISPVSLRRRFNANIENFESPSNGTIFPSQVDKRQMSLFGALWTMGSIKYLFESGAESVTWFETLGERGLMQGQIPAQWPGEFKSVPGMIFPAWHVFDFLLKHKYYRVVTSISSHPLLVEILAMANEKNLALLLTNFTSSPIKATIKGLRGKATWYKVCEENFTKAVLDIYWNEKEFHQQISLQEALTINPYSINFLVQEF